MGSNKTTVGNAAGVSAATFTAAGQDSGPLLFNVCTGYEKWVFQLTGSGTGYAVTIYGTLDRDTAAGTAVTPQWFALPGQSSEASPAWTNPLTMDSPALAVNAPLVAVRAVSSALPGGESGSVTLQIFVAP